MGHYIEQLVGGRTPATRGTGDSPASTMVVVGGGGGGGRVDAQAICARAS